MGAEEKTRPTIPAVAPAAETPSPLDAMARDEVSRINVFARLMMVLATMGAVMVPFLGGDPTARRMFALSVMWLAVLFGFLYWVSARPQRFAEWKVGLAVHMSLLAGLAMLNYFGFFSAATVVLALGIYVFSLGASFGWGLSLLICSVVIYGSATLLIVLGVLPDRGLVRVHDAPVSEQMVLLASIQCMYAVAFVLGRASRKRTLQAISELESAVRRNAERQALLYEARQELAQARRVGGKGRFSDLTLGSFQLGLLIGRGGMGEVYAATRVGTGEAAAVKLLLPHMLDRSQLVARFVREATIVSSLESPHVVRVLEFATADAPTPYIAMELLQGEDLGARLEKQGRLPLAETVDLVRQVALGVSAAHAAGVVHRDLKPPNLFLTGGTWKILDFGVSKLMGGSGTLTQDVIVGTPAYMAPEQAAGGEVDGRADVYALSAIAYRCLTGRPVVTGRDLAEMMLNVAKAMPERPSELVDLPVAIDEALAIGLAKRPDDRFQHATELVQALEAAAREELDPALSKRAHHLLDAAPWTDTQAV